jgi:hypothetical protein
MTAVVLLIFLLDSTEFYFNIITKQYFIRLDQIILLLYFATLLDDYV